MLAESVARLVADRIDGTGPAGGFAAGFDRALWQQIADLGWLGAAVSEASGGFGGARDMAVVMQGAAPLPLAGQVAPVFLGLALLESAGGAADLIGDVIGGQAIACGLIPEMMPDLVLHRGAGGVELRGVVRAVPMAPVADHLVLALPQVTIRLPMDAPGLTCEEVRSLDGVARGDLTLSQVAITPAMILAEGAAAKRVADHGRRCHAAALTAESAGLAARLFDLTLTYVQQREQFGQPIARFQALQHRMADMFIALEEARSLALAAARAAEDGATPDRALAQAVTGCVDRALHVAKEAIQLHGGVGMTDDLPLGAGLRRIKALQIMPGGADAQRRAMLAKAG